MKRLVFPLFAAAMSLLSTTAHAHFIWLEIDPDEPDTVRLRFSEEILEVTPRDMQELAAPMKVSVPGGDPLPLEFGDEFLHAPIPAGTKSVVGTLDYGVLDRSEAGRGKFMLKYHARAAADAHAASLPSTLPLDVVAVVEGHRLNVTVMFHGKPASGAEIVAVLPNQLAPVETKSDAEGRASFSIETGDWIALRAMVAEDVTGEHEGENYSLTRHYTTLTFFNPGH